MVERFNDYGPGDDPKKGQKGKERTGATVGKSARTLGKFNPEAKKRIDESVTRTGKLVGEIFPEMKQEIDAYLNESNKEEIALKKQVEAKKERQRKQQEKQRKQIETAEKRQKEAEKKVEKLEMEKALAEREKLVKKGALDKRFDELYNDKGWWAADYQDKEGNLIKISTSTDSVEGAYDYNRDPSKNITISKTLRNGKKTTFTLSQVFRYPFEGGYSIEYRIFSKDENGKEISQELKTPNEVNSFLSQIEARKKESNDLNLEKWRKEQKEKEEKRREEIKEAGNLANNENSQPDDGVERPETA